MKKIQVNMNVAQEGKRSTYRKTTLQVLQRVFVKAVGMAYGMLKGLCNHSFEGVSTGRESMNKFKKVNLR